jgi:hypothetical protein
MLNILAEHIMKWVERPVFGAMVMHRRVGVVGCGCMLWSQRGMKCKRGKSLRHND